MKFISQGYSLVISEKNLHFINNDHFFKFNGNDIIETTRQDYLIAKFGENFGEIEKYINGELNFYSGGIDKYSGIIYSCYYQENIIRLFDCNGKIFFEDINKILCQGDLIYDLIYDSKDILFIVYPTLNTLIKYSLSEKKIIKEFTKLNGLSYPESISRYDGELYIANMGCKNLLKLTKNEQLLEIEKFDEPIWEYIRTIDRQYFLLESGIYFSLI